MSTPAQPLRRWLVTLLRVLLLAAGPSPLFAQTSNFDAHGASAFSTEAHATEAAAGDMAGWVGRSAPAIEGVTLADGKPWSLASLRGKIVVFHLWGSWCPVCLRELIDDKRLEQRVRGGVVFIGIPVRDPVENVRRAVARGGIPWVQVLDSPRCPEHGFLAQLRFRKFCVPQFWVVDREGSVRGASLSLSETSAILAKLTASSGDKSRQR